MSTCSNVCSLCDRLIISDSVTYTAATNSLVIDIPAGTYYRGCKYCLVVAQAIPDTTTITALVYVSIGGDTTTLYPLVRSNCAQVTACSIRTRTRYATCVVTDTATGSFRLIGDVPCSPNRALTSLPITDAAAADTVAEASLVRTVAVPTNSTLTKTTTTKTAVSNKQEVLSNE